VRDLIRERVYQEVQDYNRKSDPDFKFLIVRDELHTYKIHLGGATSSSETTTNISALFRTEYRHRETLCSFPSKAIPRCRS
jgi:hypothetical protein